MILTQRFLLAFGLCGLVPLLGLGADDKKAPVHEASPSVFQSESHNGVVGISPNGKYMIYTPSSQKVSPSQWHILDTTTKKVLLRLPPGQYTFTPDSSRLVSICPVEPWERLEEHPPYKDDIYDRMKIPLHQVDVYDVKTGKRLHEIPLRKGQPYGAFRSSHILTLAVSDTNFVVAAKDAVATVYDLKTGKVVGDIQGKVRVPQWLALSRDGRWLLTVDNRRNLRTWDLKTRKQDRLLYEHLNDVQAIAISPDGRYCCSAARGGAVFVFDRTTGGQKAFTRFETNRTLGVAFTADGKRVVAAINPRNIGVVTFGKAPFEITKRDEGLRLWDWQKEDAPIAVMSPLPRTDLDRRGKGWFSPRVMTGDGNRFLSINGGSGILLLDLKAPLPKPEPKPEPEKP